MDKLVVVREVLGEVVSSQIIMIKGDLKYGSIFVSFLVSQFLFLVVDSVFFIVFLIVFVVFFVMQVDMLIIVIVV